jgi:hypothetical protein
MYWVQAGLVGVAGGAAIEAVDVYRSIRQFGQWPWDVKPGTAARLNRRRDKRSDDEKLPAPGKWAYLTAVLLRLFVISGPLSAVLASSYRGANSPATAFFVGIGAMYGVEKLLSLIPLVKAVMLQSIAPLDAEPEPTGGEAARAEAPSRELPGSSDVDPTDPQAEVST